MEVSLAENKDKFLIISFKLYELQNFILGKQLFRSFSFPPLMIHEFNLLEIILIFNNFNLFDYLR